MGLERCKTVWSLSVTKYNKLKLYDESISTNDYSELLNLKNIENIK